MLELCSGAGLMLEPAANRRLLSEIGPEELDGDLTSQPAVRTPPYLAHPAYAEQSKDLVRAELVTGGEGHSVDQ